MINEYETSQAASERRRQEQAEYRHAAFVVRSILAVPFVIGLGLAAWLLTRPEPSFLWLAGAVLLMVPFLATWRWTL